MRINTSRRRIFFRFLIGIIIIFILLLLIFIASPRTSSFLVRKLFEGGVAVEPDDYNLIESRVKYIEDLDYKSEYPRGFLDLALPDKGSDLPTIFWLHGGAYVAGDKEDVREYAIQIADRGYGLVNINYELAPEASYPSPLIQLAEAYRYIRDEAENYGLDMDRVYFAGDSAGAQMVSQFVNIQVDEDYAEKMGLEAIVDADTIKGVLLFCGIYDIEALSNISDSKILNSIIDNLAWSYLGDSQWRESEDAYLASIKHHISDKYPAVFITDGNFGSFQDQAEDLVSVMEDLDIDVSSVFYGEGSQLVHEYQFMMDLDESKNTFNKMIDFLEKTKNTKE